MESQKTGIVYSTSNPRVIKELGFFLSDEVQSSAQDSPYTENKVLTNGEGGEIYRSIEFTGTYSRDCYSRVYPS